MAATKFFRVAVEGATVDGRVIERQWLLDAAASYDPATYTARINCSHVVGYSPDAPFNAYGTVLSLKTETVELNISGEVQSLVALYAAIDANDQLVAVNQAGQKLFPSCEIHPNFAGTGKAYLVGLAITDTPASLGTEVLKFAAMSRENAFTPALEIDALEFEAAQADAATIGATIGAAIVSFFKRETPAVETPPAVPVTPPPANDNTFDVAAFASVMASQIGDAIKPASDAVAALATRFDALETKLATTERQAPARFVASGATAGSEALADC